MKFFLDSADIDEITEINNELKIELDNATIESVKVDHHPVDPAFGYKFILGPKNIIFSKRYIDKKNDTFVSDLWIMSGDGSEKRFFVKGSNPRWSPDGTKIAFIKEDKNKTSQIFVEILDLILFTLTHINIVRSQA